MVLLDNSSFCFGTSYRIAVCVGVLRNGHSHAMDASEIDEAKLHACNGQNITNMTFIEIVSHQPPNKAECPTPEIYLGLILYNSELYGNLPGSVTVRELTHKSDVAKGRTDVDQTRGQPRSLSSLLQRWVGSDAEAQEPISEFLQKIELAKVLRPQWCRRLQADRA